MRGACPTAQAPLVGKSLVLALYLVSIGMGNGYIALLNLVTLNPDGSSWLSDAAYYAFFVMLMLVVSLAFVPVAVYYRTRTQLQPASDSTRSDAAGDEAAEGGGDAPLGSLGLAGGLERRGQATQVGLGRSARPRREGASAPFCAATGTRSDEPSQGPEISL